MMIATTKKPSVTFMTSKTTLPVELRLCALSLANAGWEVSVVAPKGTVENNAAYNIVHFPKSAYDKSQFYITRDAAGNPLVRTHYDTAPGSLDETCLSQDVRSTLELFDHWRYVIEYLFLDSLIMTAIRAPAMVYIPWDPMQFFAAAVAACHFNTKLVLRLETTRKQEAEIDPHEDWLQSMFCENADRIVTNNATFAKELFANYPIEEPTIFNFSLLDPMNTSNAWNQEMHNIIHPTHSPKAAITLLQHTKRNFRDNNAEDSRAMVRETRAVLEAISKGGL